MDEDEKYFFDINGYIVVRGVLKAEEIAAANAAIDHYAKHIRERSGEQSLSGDSPALKGETGRGDLGGALSWDKPHCDPFRAMLAHPAIVPYMHEILGKGFRLDHNLGIITMRKGAEGHVLHGSSGPGFDPHQYYIFKNGRMHNGLTVAAWQLADIDPGDGGLCVIPGSHKGNYACPQKVRRYEHYQELVKQITCKAGDVILFSEALTNGTLPWTADRDRRTALFRYSPGNLAYANNYDWPESMLDGMSKKQRAVLEPPYHLRLDRPVLE